MVFRVFSWIVRSRKCDLERGTLVLSDALGCFRVLSGAGPRPPQGHVAQFTGTTTGSPSLATKRRSCALVVAFRPRYWAVVWCSCSHRVVSRHLARSSRRLGFAVGCSGASASRAVRSSCSPIRANARISAWIGSIKIRRVNLDGATEQRVVFGHGVREAGSAPGGDSAAQGSAAGNQPDDLAPRPGAGVRVTARVARRGPAGDGLGGHPPVRVRCSRRQVHGT